MNRFRKHLLITAMLLLGAWMLSQTAPVFAQGDTFGLTEVDQTTVLGNDDIRITIGKIIRAVLGLLGIIALVIVLYAGFIYMTSGGDEEKIGQARKLLTNGLVGLAIILSSFAIVQFVLVQLSKATGFGNGTLSEYCSDPAYATEHPEECAPDNGDDDCGQFPDSCEAVRAAFKIDSITPQTLDTKINDIKVRVIFSRPVGSPVENAIKITRNGNDVTSEFDIYFLPGSDSKVIEGVPKALCPGEPLTTCAPSGNYEIRVQTDVVRDRQGNSLKSSVNGRIYPSVASFKINALKVLDTDMPEIIALGVNNKRGTQVTLPRGATYPIQARITDNSGIGYMRLTIQKKNDGSAPLTIVYKGPKERSDAPYDFSYPFVLARNATLREVYRITVQAFDIDHRMTEETLDVTVVGALCDNGRQDDGESAADEGGECRLTSGCTTDAQCDGVCDVATGMCLPVPRITNVTPWNGAVGNWVTIEGRDFGDKAGIVEFGIDKDNDGVVDESDNWVRANLAPCTKTSAWNEKYIVVTVPVIPADLLVRKVNGSNGQEISEPIQLKDKLAIRITKADANPNRIKQYRDSTTDAMGERPGPDNGLFTVNTTRRPGLCSVQTAAGARAGSPNTDVIAVGTGFGNSPTGVSGISFGGVAGTVRSWESTAISTRVPNNIEPKKIAVDVTVDGQKSNAVPFTVLPADHDVLRPVVSSVDPTSTTPGSLVTISGKGFGNTGSVLLAPRAGLRCDNIIADGCIPITPQGLPESCGRTWKTTQIIGQIPANTPPADYIIVVKNSENIWATGEVQLEVVAGAARPGICAISPDNGPAPRPENSPIRLIGVNFSQAPTVYFWSRRANLFDTSTWLSPTQLRGVSNTMIVTPIPVSGEGYSILSGPVKVRAEGVYSNSVRYTVQDCRDLKSSEIPNGMQCCRAGDDAGSLKSTNQVCAGETREAGYVWRFTTGKIPRIPHVLENECRIDTDDWQDPNSSAEFPSPTPWSERGQTNVCLNATVAVRFNMPMDASTLTGNNIRVFTCDQSANGKTADCSDKIPVDADELTISYQSDTLTIREAEKNGISVPNLKPNTWYRVELSTKIQSHEEATVLGQQRFLPPQSLQKTRPCGTTTIDGVSYDTSYCFEFKTGGNICQIAAVGINPTSHLTDLLGLVARPPGSDNPLYYLLWGRGNQACTVVNVDNKGWQWHSTSPAASVSLAPGNNRVDTRATVEALHEGTADIVASASFSHQEKKTTTSIEEQPVVVSDILASVGASAGLTVITNYTSNGVVLVGGKEVTAEKDIHDIKNKTVTVRFSLDDVADNDPAWASSFDNTEWQIQRVVYFKPDTYYFGVLESRNKQTGQRSRLFSYNYRTTGGWWAYASTQVSGSDVNSGEQVFSIITTDNTTKVFRNGTLFHTSNDVLGVSSGVFTQGMYLGTTFEGVAGYALRGTIRELTIKAVSQNSSSNTVASTVHDGTLSATSTLTVALTDPTLTSVWPRCNQACTNATIGMTFSRPMISDTFAAGVSMRECADDQCNTFATDSNGQPIVYTSEDFEQKLIDSRSYRIKPKFALKPNTWYLVNASNSILSVGQINADGSIRPGAPLSLSQEFNPWKFKTKAQDAECSVEAVSVVPLSFTATAFGQKTRYAAIPLSAPDACSENGQELDPWDYGWDWSVDNENVATVSDFESIGTVPSYCSALTCLPNGSSVARNTPHTVLCGNGIVDLDKGEDCDIGRSGEQVGVSCSVNCLRPGSKAPQCGDGIVDWHVGEECDTADAVTKDYCTAQCTLKGNIIEKGTSYCGDGSRNHIGNVFIEDCDTPGTNGCNAACMHVGTEVSAAWCESAPSNPASQQACVNAKTVCGNGVIEHGEECEIGENATAATCDNRCLLRNVCNESAPIKQCDAGTPGCNADCTLAGSSVGYGQPSLCGDGTPGLGESLQCETHLVAGQSRIGQNPLQMVTAVGNASVDPVVKKQETRINARVVAQRTAEGIKNVGAVAAGHGEYTLQCGFTEYKTPVISGNSVAYNDCPAQPGTATRGLAFGVGSNSCCFPRPQRVSEYPQDGTGISGANNVLNNFEDSLDTFKSIYARQYRVKRDALVNAFTNAHIADSYATLNTAVAAYLAANPDQRAGMLPGVVSAYDTFMVQRDAYAQVVSQLGIDAPVMTNLEDLQSYYDEMYTRIESIHHLDTIAAVGEALDNIEDSIANTDFYSLVPRSVYNPSVTFFEKSYAFGVALTVTDDPDVVGKIADAFTRLGASVVQMGSAVDAYKTSNAPVSFVTLDTAIRALQRSYGAAFSNGPVCRNTLIAVSFNDQISRETIDNNIVIARAQKGGVCPGQQQNVTDAVRGTLAFQVDESVGGLRGVWNNIKNFFFRLFGKNALAAEYSPGNGYIWCSGAVTATTNVSYQTIANKTVTTVSLALEQPLDPDTYYAVLLRGGVEGIKSTRGIGIRSLDADSLNDSWVFKTKSGNALCKLDTVSIQPAQYLFTAPNTSTAFIAQAQGTEGSGLITPIKGQYDWIWSWGPQNHPIFAIPAPNTPTNTPNMVIASKNLEGEATGVANARIITDVDTANSDVGLLKTGMTKLRADFCERPWPQRSEFPFENHEYNFSMSYCSDAGVAGKTQDDLPYLDMQVLDLSDNERSTGGLSKILFVDKTERYDDAIGLRIMTNPGRQSASQWFDTRFPQAQAPRSTVVAGYDAVIDGNTYYINFLNEESVGDVDNYILVLTLNTGAQAPMKQVFDQLLASLEFNTNMTDFGYCQNAQQDPHPSIHSNTGDISSTMCSSDFDCLQVNGVPKDGLSGICSNAKTKFHNDWQRIHDIAAAQGKLKDYKNDSRKGNGSYPTLGAGSFIPHYTTSFWATSWGTLSQQILGFPRDPVDKKSSCDDPAADPSTCWNAKDSTYSCPNYSSVYEYKYNPTTKDYMIHGKLEYFAINNPIVTQTIDASHFMTTPGCVPKQRYSPFGEKCGDGVVNVATEECDPPEGATVGTRTSSPVVIPGTCADGNKATGVACVSDAICGNHFTFHSINGSQSLKDKDLTVYSDKSSVCGYKVPAIGYWSILFDSDQREVQGHDTKLYAFGCTQDADCRNPDTYSDRLMNGVNGNLYNYPYTAGTTFGALVPQLASNPNNYKCIPLQQFANDAANFGTPETDPVSCEGITTTLQCPSEQFATASCNSSCRFTYGECKKINNCGNGKIEVGERCDDGVLNGTYGHCNLECREFVAASCGNGQADAGEFCDWSDASTNTPRYFWNKVNSCSADCQGYGGYCGDGIKQAEEQCEVGDVNNSTDLCFKRGDRWFGEVPPGTPAEPDKYPNDAGYGYSEHNTTFWYTFPLERGNYSLSIEAFNEPGDDFSGETNVQDGACSNVPGVQLHFTVTMVDVNKPGDQPKNIGSTCIDALPRDVMPASLRTGKVQTGLVNAGTYRFAITWDNDWSRRLVSPRDGTPADLVRRSMGRDLNPDGSLEIDTDAAINVVSLNATRQYICRTGGENACSYLKLSNPNSEWGRLDNPADLSTYRCVPMATAVAPTGAYCGDGIKQSNEACDLGKENGSRPGPIYGRTQTYCSAPSRDSNDVIVPGTGCQVLQVDPIAYCGNGTIDPIGGTNADGSLKMEACDTERNANGTMSVVSSTPGGSSPSTIPQCPGENAGAGSYSCNATCTQLINNCLACGKIPQKGALPKLAVFNVLTSSDPEKNWGRETLKELYLLKTSLGGSNWTKSQEVQDADYENYMEQKWMFVSPKIDGIPSDPAFVPSTFEGLQTSPLCSAKYSVLFNKDAVESALDDQGVNTQDVDAVDPFPYPVNGENAVVNNELIITPVPRPGEFRVVMRYPNENNIRLNGIVYNQESYVQSSSGVSVSSQPLRYSLVEASVPTLSAANVCTRTVLSGTDTTPANNRYWLPLCSGALPLVSSDLRDTLFDGKGAVVYAHAAGHLDKTAAQAVTIYPQLPLLINPNLPTPKSYAFVVEGISAPIGEYTDKEVFVDVYIGGKANTVPRYSILKPDLTFSLQKAKSTSTSGNVKYWHLFNIVKRGNSFQISTSTTGVDGELETSWASETGTDGVLGNYAQQQ